MSETKGDGCTDCDSCGDGCSCVHVINTCECYTSCECKKTGKITHKHKFNKNKRTKITKKTKVAFRARKVPLEQVALLLNKIFPNKVLLPVTKIKTKTTKRFKNAEIGKVVSSLGLQIK